MPIYEYQCQSCGHQHEAIQKISDQPLIDCPACHQPSLSKLISSTSFQLKGTGWYATDFRDKGKPKQDTKTETDSGQNGGKNAESAPEKKSNDTTTG